MIKKFVYLRIILQPACVLILQEKTDRAVHLCKALYRSPSVQCVKGKHKLIMWLYIIFFYRKRILCLLGRPEDVYLRLEII